MGGSASGGIHRQPFEPIATAWSTTTRASPPAAPNPSWPRAGAMTAWGTGMPSTPAPSTPTSSSAVPRARAPFSSPPQALSLEPPVGEERTCSPNGVGGWAGLPFLALSPLTRPLYFPFSLLPHNNGALEGIRTPNFLIRSSRNAFIQCITAIYHWRPIVPLTWGDGAPKGDILWPPMTAVDRVCKCYGSHGCSHARRLSGEIRV
jgi:hypothetical protein